MSGLKANVLGRELTGVLRDSYFQASYVLREEKPLQVRVKVAPCREMWVLRGRVQMKTLCQHSHLKEGLLLAPVHVQVTLLVSFCWISRVSQGGAVWKEVVSLSWKPQVSSSVSLQTK